AECACARRISPPPRKLRFRSGLRRGLLTPKGSDPALATAASSVDASSLAVIARFAQSSQREHQGSDPGFGVAARVARQPGSGAMCPSCPVVAVKRSEVAVTDGDQRSVERAVSHESPSEEVADTFTTYVPRRTFLPRPSRPLQRTVTVPAGRGPFATVRRISPDRVSTVTRMLASRVSVKRIVRARVPTRRKPRVSSSANARSSVETCPASSVAVTFQWYRPSGAPAPSHLAL